MKTATIALLASATAVMISARRSRKLRRALAAADRASITDSLTGIANRAGLHREFEQLVVAMAPDHRLGVVLLDLDDFKPVNDQHGHDVGDEVLRQMAERLSNRRSEKCIPFATRLGGDEFALLARLDGNGDGLTRTVAEIVSRFHEPIVTDAATVRVSVSAGITHERAERANLAQLLAEVDAAMYRAKRMRASLCVYDRSTDGPLARTPRPSHRTRDNKQTDISTCTGIQSSTNVWEGN